MWLHNLDEHWNSCEQCWQKYRSCWPWSFKWDLNSALVKNLWEQRWQWWTKLLLTMISSRMKSKLPSRIDWDSSPASGASGARLLILDFLSSLIMAFTTKERKVGKCPLSFLIVSKRLQCHLEEKKTYKKNETCEKRTLNRKLVTLMVNVYLINVRTFKGKLFLFLQFFIMSILMGFQRQKYISLQFDHCWILMIKGIALYENVIWWWCSGEWRSIIHQYCILQVPLDICIHTFMSVSALSFLIYLKIRTYKSFIFIRNAKCNYLQFLPQFISPTTYFSSISQNWN